MEGEDTGVETTEQLFDNWFDPIESDTRKGVA